uniref:Uncharacterized protein n=1 Tax=Chrysotila carterae TaxID=13221 RepID=A0A7S4EWX0_CHRCT
MAVVVMRQLSSSTLIRDGCRGGDAGRPCVPRCEREPSAATRAVRTASRRAPLPNRDSQRTEESGGLRRAQSAAWAEQSAASAVQRRQDARPTKGRRRKEAMELLCSGGASQWRSESEGGALQRGGAACARAQMSRLDCVRMLASGASRGQKDENEERDSSRRQAAELRRPTEM